MKKKTVFTVVSLALLALQAQTVFADYNDDFENELNRNNIRNIERLLERRSRQMNLNYCLYLTLMSETHVKGFNKANCLDVVRLLVRYGANVNEQYILRGGTSRGYPLENAVERKHSIAVIQFLLDSGANPNYSSHSFPPVRRAYSNRDMPVVNLLLDRGANGADILPSAGSRGDNEMIRLLIARGVQIRSEQGAEALRWAAVDGHFDTIKLLVENGVNVNARS
ncbi:MAG: ankyrin repeat domain-containing protein, partial [Treponema sp.]|nr:ankyrin repeat domain-containing protein [Treponema sp.]